MPGGFRSSAGVKLRVCRADFRITSGIAWMNLLASLSFSSLFLILSFQESVCQDEFFSKYSCENEDIKKFIVNRHNELRLNVQPTPANMLRMKWHEEAAANAIKWAKTCPTGHSKQDLRRTDAWGCGENLFLSSRLISWSKVLQGWWDENKDFQYGKGATEEGKVIGHYTQFVWHKSWQLGCAIHFCPQSPLCYIYVCHYCPAFRFSVHNVSPHIQREKQVCYYGKIECPLTSAVAEQMCCCLGGGCWQGMVTGGKAISSSVWYPSQITDITGCQDLREAQARVSCSALANR
ncbi:PREDICTED: cysteine-rich venom protein LEI1-like [Nanorana parkeri]|uniref:cysteine-rich venom protein LEI1-like n=1 Tax=Nanorana parkeri TaxID=125878 RepID=UPI000854606B|nr:PREDICTED: cysteine-rich venom protein LEI1-like [Nanorana parkeri]